MIALWAGDGTQPNADGTACVPCVDGTAGRGGSCEKQCDREHAVSSADRTECVCPAGTYDTQQQQQQQQGHESTLVSENLRIYCWRVERKVDTVPWSPTFGAVLFEEDDLNAPSVTDLTLGQRCVTCPSCVTCNASGSILVNEGYAAAFPASQGELNLYECPPAHSNCSSFNIRVDEGKLLQVNDGDMEASEVAAAVASNCAGRFSGTLCSDCSSGFYASHATCKACGSNPMARLAMAVLGCIVALLFVRWSIKHFLSQKHKDEAEFWVRVFEKSWPRFKQSFRILVTNLQITTNIARVCDVTWPATFTLLLQQVTSIVNADMFELPGMACIAPTSFYAKWLVKMGFLPLSLGLIYAYHRYQVLRLLEEDRRLLASLPVTQPPDHARLLSHKLQLTVKLGHAMTHAADLAFMLVYIAWPSIAKACFQLFRCRMFENQISLLEADLTLPCTDTSGEYANDYVLYHALGIASVLVFPIGVPLGLGLWLYSHRETVKRNPEYVTLVFLKPVFMFYKSDKYLFEIFAMFEKVLLIGLMSLWQTSTFQKATQVLISTCSLTFIALNMPSKTQQYNYANLLSRILIVITFLSTIVLDTDLDASGVTASQVDVLLLLTQLVMFVFLIYISTNKLLLMIRTSKAQVEAEIQLESLDFSDPRHGTAELRS